jgi:hypothetical protein
MFKFRRNVDVKELPLIHNVVMWWWNNKFFCYIEQIKRIYSYSTELKNILNMYFAISFSKHKDAFLIIFNDKSENDYKNS